MKKICLSLLAFMFFGTFLPYLVLAETSKEGIVQDLNTSLKNIVFTSQTNNGIFKDKWKNRYHFAIEDTSLVITFTLDVTTLKHGEENTRVYETGTYSTFLDQLSPVSVQESKDGAKITLECVESNSCFQAVYTESDTRKDKTLTREREKSFSQIRLFLPATIVPQISSQLRVLFE